MQNERHTIHCPEKDCNEQLCKISTPVGTELETKCPKCNTKLFIRFTQDKTKIYKEYN